MSRYEVLLFIHLLAAFAAVAGTVMFVSILLGLRRASESTALARLSGLAAILWNAGGLGVLVFGIWLALDVDGYEVWDAWVLIAIGLWFVASAAGGPISRDYRTAIGEGAAATVALAQRSRSVVLHVVMSLAVLLLLVDMIFKPGAS
jgi:hypothetical protein